MDPEQLFIGRALDRIQLLIAFLSGAGVLTTAVYAGCRWALGYMLGTAAGYLNFLWLKKLVDSLRAPAGGHPAPARAAVFPVFPHRLPAPGCHVLLNFSPFP